MANINLMSEKKPTKVKRRAGAAAEESQAPVILFAALVAITLAVLVFWWLHLNGVIEENNRKIDEAKAEKKRLEAIIKQVEEFQKQKALLEQKINIIDELKRKQSGPVHLLDEISTAIPEFLWLLNLKEVGREIQIKGQATNIIAITNFVGNLEKSTWFKNVDLKETKAVTKPQGYSFTVYAQFTPPVPPKPPGQEGDAAATAEEEDSSAKGKKKGKKK